MHCINCGQSINDKSDYCTNCGKKVGSNTKSSKVKLIINKRRIKIICIIIIISLSCILILNYLFSSLEQDVTSSVVNIYCTTNSENDEEEVSGGSGTIMTTDGLVLTNSHIIPQNEEGALVDENDCIVVLPDQATGAPKEMYYAQPIIIPEISEKYDLAFIQINDVYYDQEEQKAYGEYPKQFPAFNDQEHCKNENVRLGEPVRIYGYPALSGGYALTITDGVVSSLLIDEGLIVTSAKISFGNSGGLAVDQNGCRIGIPAMVNSDENESLGVIISNDLIADFMDEVSAVLEQL